MSVFDKRIEFKPYEYPDVIKFKEAVQHSYWLHSEWSFVSDVQDFKTKLTDQERNAIKNALLAISQIEVSVKKFWVKVGDRFPKSEFDQVGITFGESECRHAEAYSHLLEVLGLNADFKKLLEVPAIKNRIDYLSKYLGKSMYEQDNRDYMLTLALFTIFTENISLFSQFIVIKSFNKYKNCLKDIDNVIQATVQEEILHALFGMYLINITRKEFPEWFDESFYNKLNKACLKAYEHESNIIDWIFEQGELSFLPKDIIKEYIKHRFNESVKMIGSQDIFEVNQNLVKELEWFDNETVAELNTDFFNKRPVTYTKFTKSFNEGDLF